MQKAHVDQNTIRAVLALSVALLSCWFPLPTFSLVNSESATSASMCSAWIVRLAASVVWSSEISRRDFSAALFLVSLRKIDRLGYLPNLVQMIFVVFQHILVLLGEQLKLLRIELLL